MHIPNSRLPISALEHNLIASFEKIAIDNNHNMKAAVHSGKVHPEIDLILDKIPPKGAYATLCSRKIVVYESYLAFLWSYCYSNFVIFEAGVQRPMLKGNYSGQIEFNSSLLQGAKALESWWISFAHEYANWDIQNLPNPKAPRNKLEKCVGEKVNAIFLQSVNFVLLHEYAHLVLGHKKTSDKSWNLEQEKDADNYAINFLINNYSNEKERHIIGLSLVLLFASAFYIPRTMRGIWQGTHPNLHDRLCSAISSLNLGSEEARYYIYHLASISLQRYLENHQIRTERLEAETSEELFFKYLEVIDSYGENGI